MSRRQGDVSRWTPDFLALSVIWGSSFALIKVAVDAGLEPLWVAFARCLFGAVAVLAVCAVRRERLPTTRDIWAHAGVVALLLNVLPFSLLAYGETQVSSVLAGVINATVPLTTLLVASLLVPSEQLTQRRLAGLAVGFVGVVVVVGMWTGVGDATLAGSLACVASAFFLGCGFAYTRRFFSGRDGSAAALSAAQLVCATCGLAVAAPVGNGMPTWPGWGAAAGTVVLGAVGTGFAFIINLRVIRVAGPTVASTVTYVIPLWSILLGTLLLDEALHWNTVAGTALVLAGVLLARSPAAGPARAGPVRPGQPNEIPPLPAEESPKGSRR